MSCYFWTRLHEEKWNARGDRWELDGGKPSLETRDGQFEDCFVIFHNICLSAEEDRTLCCTVKSSAPSAAVPVWWRGAGLGCHSQFPFCSESACLKSPCRLLKSVKENLLRYFVVFETKLWHTLWHSSRKLSDYSGWIRVQLSPTRSNMFPDNNTASIHLWWPFNPPPPILTVPVWESPWRLHSESCD